jgi:hypothetical protein
MIIGQIQLLRANLNRARVLYSNRVALFQFLNKGKSIGDHD